MRVVALLIVLSMWLPAVAQTSPKREFRGAWLHTVYQEGYRQRTTAQNQQYLRCQLDSLASAGVNAVLFQVRPQADAFYASSLEPWSCYLTADGSAPQPMWDPLDFMVGECHKRGMELHAWLNPYRVTSSARQIPAKGHIYHKHPGRFLRYDGKLYFDPALPENRQHIVAVVNDIIERYDVDGIHFDDYFYPYPVKGKNFPDDASFSKYGGGLDRSAWRRANVDSLISDIHDAIADGPKPWVRFGISPFGIWRNRTSDPRGSETSGLENYDGLYADVLLWIREGWIDYVLPQLYWELDHSAASYRVLVDWWAENINGRHLFIGQDVDRTMKKGELSEKLELQRRRHEISGHCLWPGYAVVKNVGGIADSLAGTYHSAIALVPSCPWKDSDGPWPVEVRANGKTLRWNVPEAEGVVEDAVRFVVYRSDSPEVDINEPDAIVAVTPNTEHVANRSGYYVVTALDRVNNESAPSDVVYVR